MHRRLGADSAGSDDRDRHGTAIDDHDTDHIEARTRVKNVGKTKATILHLNHRVYVGNEMVPVRSKHPQNMFMAPGGVFGFAWDLDLPKGWRLTDPGSGISITVDIDYMGIGTRSYRYEGRYEFSAARSNSIAPASDRYSMRSANSSGIRSG